MRYSTEVIIDLPMDQVLPLFDNADNLSKWMKGLVYFETIEGEAGQVGAKSIMRFELGKRKMEMTETILKHDLPQEYLCSYEAPGTYNEVKIHFEEIDKTHTKYVAEHFFKFESWAMKLMGALMPGMFKKQSLQYSNDFKAFAEGEALA